MASTHGAVLALAACVLSAPYDIPRSVCSIQETEFMHSENYQYRSLVVYDIYVAHTYGTKIWL